MIHWFCLISWRLFDIWTPYFGIMSQYDRIFDLQIKVGHCDLYFMVQWFLPYILTTVWCMNIILQDYESVWPDIDLKITRSLWPIIHGPVTLSYIMKSIWYMNTILWDYESVWPDVRPKINVGHCDLYFMVKWFCLISWRLFAIWTPQFGIMSQYGPVFDLKISRSLWPIFPGPVILPYILRSFWCMNIVLQDYESIWSDIWPQNKCRWMWPIFHGPVILPYILKTMHWLNIVHWEYDLTSDLKIFIGHCHLHFMVQWFCLISWRLFYVWTLYFMIMSQCNVAFALPQNNVIMVQ